MKNKKWIAAGVTVLCAALTVFAIGTAAGSKTPGTGNRIYRENTSGFEEFSYELKGEYTSHKQVSDELDAVYEAFRRSTEGCSDEYIQSQRVKFHSYTDQLYKIIRQFPLNEQEKLERTKKLYELTIEHVAEEYALLERVGGDNMQKELLLYKNMNNEFQAVDSEYRNGKFTVQEAYDKIIEIRVKYCGKPPESPTGYDANVCTSFPSGVYIKDGDAVSHPQ